MTNSIQQVNDKILWESYQTARNESVAAQQSMQGVIGWSMTVAALVIAALSFLKSQNNLTTHTLFIGWAIIAALGLLAASQYIGEVGRMLRAGYYSRQIERIIWQQQNPNTDLGSKLMWEGFLTLKKHRLHWTYRLGMLAAFGALIVSQILPFIIYDSPSYYYAYPVVGIILSLGLLFAIGKIYEKRFPDRDLNDSDPVDLLLFED